MRWKDERTEVRVGVSLAVTPERRRTTRKVPENLELTPFFVFDRRDAVLARFMADL